MFLKRNSGLVSTLRPGRHTNAWHTIRQRRDVTEEGLQQQRDSCNLLGGIVHPDARTVFAGGHFNQLDVDAVLKFPSTRAALSPPFVGDPYHLPGVNDLDGTDRKAVAVRLPIATGLASVSGTAIGRDLLNGGAVALDHKMDRDPGIVVTQIGMELPLSS